MMGVVTGFLGAAPAIVWASGVLFVTAFFIMVPLAIWIYTLVFVFSSLWFIHFSLAALERLRNEQSTLSSATPVLVQEGPAPTGLLSSSSPPLPLDEGPKP
jgi:heme O synthase-like polyprenyltransferase